MSIRNWKRHFSARKVAALAMIVFVVVAVNNTLAGRIRKATAAEALAPVPTQLGISGRRLFRLRHGECIVLRPPIELMSDEEHQRYLGTDEEADLVRHVLPPDSVWYVEPNRLEEQSTFNCATFAIGDVVGLSRADFLDPRAASFTNNQNPAYVLLQEFFRCLATYPVAEVNWDELDRLDSFKDDDVVVFATRGSDEEYVHLGRIAKWEGRNRMISKMGRGPIVRGTIERTAQAYEGRFDEIRIYRRR